MNNIIVLRTMAVTGLVIALPIAGAAQVTACFDCLSCQVALNGSFAEVDLVADITNHVGTCIAFNNDNQVFDCGGHTIDGDSSGTDYGIEMLWGTNNEIRNCVVRDFYNGIFLWGSTDHNVTNNTLTSNNYGIRLGNNASSNTVTENWSYRNGIGLTIEDSNNNTLRRNDSCSQMVDIWETGTSAGNNGVFNRCNNTSGWDDNGATGCSVQCSQGSLEQMIACKYMRDVGNAWMSWLIDQVSKQAGTTASGKASTYDMSPLSQVTVEEMRTMLYQSPEFYYYASTISDVDPWGQTYEYWLNDNVLVSNVLVIRTTGADGRFEGLVYEVEPVSGVQSHDLVWGDGYFVRWQHDACSSSLIFGDTFETADTSMWQQ